MIFTISGTKDNLGTVSILPSSIKEANLNSALVRLDLDTSKITKEFFSYFFDLNIARRQIEFIGKGAAQNNLNNEEISDIKIPLPSIEIQKSLVAEIEVARQNRKQKLAKAEELLSSIDSYLLEKIGIDLSKNNQKNKINNLGFAIKLNKLEDRLDCQFHLPEHHALENKLRETKIPVFNLGNSNITQSIVDGPFGSQLKVDEYQDTGVPLIRVSNCRTGEIIENDNLVYISEEKHQALIRSEVLPGDILLTKAGSLGYSVVFPKKLVKGNITSHLARIRTSKKIIAEFLSIYLKSSLGIKQLYRYGNKTTRPELNTDEVRKILIPLPSKEIQQSIIDEVGKRTEKARRLRQEAELEWETAKTRFEQKLLGEET